MMQQQQNGDVFDNNNLPNIHPPPWSLPPVHSFNPPRVEPDHFLVPSSPYAALFNRRGVPSLQFAAYDGPSTSDHHLRIISDTLGVGVGSQVAHQPGGFQAELGKMTAQEIMDAKALAASKSHSEAERRRRERINNHLAKLRSLLPNTTKTDKASLLAEVIQHVKELKRQTSIIAETSAVPTEADELTVDEAADEDGRVVIKASLCCEDRSDLLPDLIKTLKDLRLRTVKAEITTLGGRVKNVLFITREEEEEEDEEDDDEEEEGCSNISSEEQKKEYCIRSIQEALKAVMEKNGGGGGDDSGSVRKYGCFVESRVNTMQT
ncbi:transcription factor bHLH30-like [Senna tora]|uniref:Transcription factor bHLH30-like n=1 Tax=Senna tora TaxID=362788 RepID=A0A834U1L4_9FABA|nr:transcription factor bHLH30-like [Senna tora]